MVLLMLCMILVPMLIGNGILRVIYGKKAKGDFSAADILLTGEIVVIGTAEAAHLCTVFAGLSFSRGTVVFGVIIAVLTLAGLAAAFFFRTGRISGLGEIAEFRNDLSRKISNRCSVFTVLFCILVLSQAIYILSGSGVYRGGDMTVETVGSFLYTDRVYQVNPMTGSDYLGGIPLRLQILCLPGLYGALCRLFALEPVPVVWKVIPLAVLISSYSAFSCLGRCFFAEDKKKRHCFLAVMALLIWAGSFYLGMDGFGILCSGWRGVVIRNAVLVPFMISLLLRKKWVPVVFCIAAEACITWTFYGAGVCLLTAVSLSAVRFVLHRTEASVGKEASG